MSDHIPAFPDDRTALPPAPPAPQPWAPDLYAQPPEPVDAELVERCWAATKELGQA